MMTPAVSSDAKAVAQFATDVVGYFPDFLKSCSIYLAYTEKYLGRLRDQPAS